MTPSLGTRRGRGHADNQPFVRRIVTRCIGVVPAAIVAAAMGGQGLNTMLVASQVVLSVVLPTVIFPLVYLCSKREVMTVNGPELELTSDPVPDVQEEVRPAGQVTETERDGGMDRRRQKYYTSPKWVTVLGYLLAFAVLLANVYVFVQLGLGN